MSHAEADDTGRNNFAGHQDIDEYHVVDVFKRKHHHTSRRQSSAEILSESFDVFPTRCSAKLSGRSQD